MKSISKFLQIAAVSILLITIGCTSPQDLLQTGQYDPALIESIKRLSKKKKKRKDVEVVEAAFRKVTAKDMQRIENLKKEGVAENWIEINRIHRDIKKRQEMIEPYLPLVAKDGYKADFRFVKIDALELQSKERAATVFYTKAQDLMFHARNGNRYAAREAFSELDNVYRYYKNFKDVEALQAEALDLGQTYVLFKSTNESGRPLPPRIEDDILKLNVKDFDSRWLKYYNSPDAKESFDRVITLKVKEIGVGRESYNQLQFVESKEIDDGFDYVLDNRGNVMKDTLGNDIKIARTKVIFGTVIEVHQFKDATVGGVLEVFDTHQKEIIRTEPVVVNRVFENYAATFTGDRRALSSRACRYLGNTPRPFPSDEYLVGLAVENLEPLVYETIRNNSGDIVMK